MTKPGSARSSRAARRAREAMRTASTYEEWKAAAKAYDTARGLDEWRRVDRTHRYDYVLLRGRRDELRRLREQRDDHGLLYTLNEGIHGNVGGMGRASLYEKTAFGTKDLVVDYVEALVEALEHIADPATTCISRTEKLHFFRRVSRCFGNSALMLSGSGTLFFFHVGVLRALTKEGLLPRTISGASGGALVAAVAGTHRPEQLLDVLTAPNFRDLLRPPPSAPKRYRSFRRMVLARRIELLEKLIPDLTFEEAYARSGLGINVSIAPIEVHQSSGLLSAITSPHVYVREGVAASSALPGLFPSVVLAAKNRDGQRQPYLPERRWIDGSASEDLPTKRITRLYGVNHFIVSQTNPHVLPFVTDAKLHTTKSAVVRRTAQRTVRELVNGTAALFQKRLSREGMVPRVVNQTLSVINQDYLGDINIIAPSTPNLFQVLAWRTEEQARALIDQGERATWPHMERIRLQTRVSRTLTSILTRFEGAPASPEEPRVPSPSAA
ncbi:MAG: DUF3336 domain-containing protein [Sandaracinaceae bacterium]